MLKTIEYIEHLTINSGHSRLSPRAEVSRSIIEVLKPIVLNGGGYLPEIDNKKYIIDITEEKGNWIYTLYRETEIGDFPLVISILVLNENSNGLWEKLITEFKNYIYVDYVAKPITKPYLACVFFLTADMDELLWLGDFERCLAWTILEVL